jgi:beta-lactamase regulating signal transducer with metallopeptidase domain/HEAT repeat protein
MESVTLILSERFLPELVLKGALLMTLAFAITFVFQRASAALRHAIWSLAFIGLLLLPLCAAFLPKWQLSLPEFPAVEALLPKWSESLLSEPRGTEANSEVTAKPNGPAAFDVLEPARATAEPLMLAEPSDPNATPPLASTSPSATWFWTSLALLLWFSIAIVLLIRLAVVLGKLSLLRHCARPVTDPEWMERAELLRDVLDIRRPVLLYQHEKVVVPMTYGVRRPVIFLPVQADDWSEDQKHVTLIHELLHVKRFDHLVHVLALTARALHWFNPLTWAATKRLILERERACDDGVLAMGVASTSYADHLLGMARYVLSGKEASAGALAMARPSELRSRIVAILNPGQSRRAITRLRALGMAGCAMIFVVLFAAMQPSSGTRNVPSGPTIQLDKDASGAESRSHHAIAGLDAEGDIDPGDAAETGEIAIAEEQLAETGEIAIAEEQLADTIDIETQRRAIHAISELPRERSIPLLREIAETHGNVELRAEAVFWLGQVGDGSTADLLESFARNDASDDVQRKAVLALSEIEGDAGIARLIDLAKTHPNSEMQAEAVFWLGQHGIGQDGGSEIVDILADFARTGATREVQQKAIFALSEVDGDEGVLHLIDLAKTHPDPELRSEAIFWLGETGDPRAADVLMEIVNGR